MGGSVGAGLIENKANSAFNLVEVEVEAELGNFRYSRNHPVTMRKALQYNYNFTGILRFQGE